MLWLQLTIAFVCKQVSTFLLNLVKRWLGRKSELFCLGQLATGVKRWSFLSSQVSVTTKIFLSNPQCFVTSWMQKQANFNSMMEKGCKKSKNIEQSYRNDHLKFLFRVLFFYTRCIEAFRWYSGFLYVKERYLFLRWLFPPYYLIFWMVWKQKSRMWASTGQTVGSIGAEKFSPPAVYINLLRLNENFS